MRWSRTLFKIVALTTIGFVIPVAMLLPVEYALSEFGTQPDWNTLLNRYLPTCTGCSLLFFASAITSSTPRKIVTFVQSLFLHGVSFIVCFISFVPIQHNKVADPQRGHLAWIPFVVVLLVFIALMVIENMHIAVIGKDLKPFADTTPDKYEA